MLERIRLPSFHDDHLVHYEVNCEARHIILTIREAQSADIRNVIFSEVEGYRFVNDAFENIILDLEEVSPIEILYEFKTQIIESFHLSGAPGPWAADIDAAGIKFNALGVRGFVLSSSYGMSGWILAKQVIIQHGIKMQPIERNM